MRDFDAIFDQLPADPKVVGNLGGIPSLNYEPAQRSVGHQRRRANRISSFFIIVIVVTGRGVTRSRRLFTDARRLFTDDRQAVWRMAQENVRDFFHQRGAISLVAVSGIEDYQFPAVRQGSRASAA